MYRPYSPGVCAGLFATLFNEEVHLFIGSETEVFSDVPKGLFPYPVVFWLVVKLGQTRGGELTPREELH